MKLSSKLDLKTAALAPPGFKLPPKSTSIGWMYVDGAATQPMRRFHDQLIDKQECHKQTRSTFKEPFDPKKELICTVRDVNKEPC